MGFKIGDRVRVITLGSRYFGEETSVIGPLMMCETTDIESREKCPPHYCYRVDIAVPGFRNKLCVNPEHLRLIDDDPELGSWDEIERITDWHPEAITV